MVRALTSRTLSSLFLQARTGEEGWACSMWALSGVWVVRGGHSRFPERCDASAPQTVNSLCGRVRLAADGGRNGWSGSRGDGQRRDAGRAGYACESCATTRGAARALRGPADALPGTRDAPSAGRLGVPGLAEGAAPRGCPRCVALRPSAPAGEGAGADPDAAAGEWRGDRIPLRVAALLPVEQRLPGRLLVLAVVRVGARFVDSWASGLAGCPFLRLQVFVLRKHLRGLREDQSLGRDLASFRAARLESQGRGGS